MATEKTPIQTPPTPPPLYTATSTVRRRLDFGRDAEREEAEHNLSASLDLPYDEAQKERQRAREKWNFDFENEVPLDGDWEWEKVGGEEVPEVKEVVSSMKEIRKENRNL